MGCTKLEKLNRESVLHFTAHASLNIEAIMFSYIFNFLTKPWCKQILQYFSSEFATQFSPTVRTWHFDYMDNVYIHKERNITPLRTLENIIHLKIIFYSGLTALQQSLTSNDISLTAVYFCS